MVDTFTLIAGKPTIFKDPGAVLDYTCDFTAWLAAMRDTLASHTVTATGITWVSSTNDSKMVVMWLANGAVGVPASATIKITTAAGRIDERTLFFKIKNK